MNASMQRKTVLTVGIAQLLLAAWFAIFPALRGDRFLMKITVRHHNATKHAHRLLHAKDAADWSLTQDELLALPERVRTSYIGSIKDGMAALNEIAWIHGVVAAVLALSGTVIIWFSQSLPQRNQNSEFRT